MTRSVTVWLGPAYLNSRGEPHGWRRAQPFVTPPAKLPPNRKQAVAALQKCVRMVLDKGEDEYQTRVAQLIWSRWHQEHRGPIEQACALDVTALFKRPKAMKPGPRLWCTKKPDDDNIGKSIRDALQRDAMGRPRPSKHRGAWGLISDDKLIVDAHTSKLYCASDESPGMLITIKELEA